MGLVPFELLIQLVAFLILSRVFKDKRAIGWLWLKRLVYFVPPLTEEVVYLEENPDKMKQWLKSQGRTSAPTRGKEKDAIQLATAPLDGEGVIADEGRAVRKNPLVAGLNASSLIEIRHKVVSADMAHYWRTFVDLTIASLLALAVTSITTRFFTLDPYLQFSARGVACIVLGLAAPPIYLLYKVLWRRASNSFEWGISWIVALAFVIVVWVLLAPTPTNTTPFWNLETRQGWFDMKSTFFNFTERAGVTEKPQESIKKVTTIEDRQKGLQKLFSQNPDKPIDTKLEGDWWLQLDEKGDADYWIFRIAFTVLAAPLGLVLFVGINRQVKSMLQARSNPKIPSLYRMLEYVNVFAMPAIVVVLWSTPIPAWLESAGIFESAERVYTLRRTMSIFFAVQQLATLRAGVQSHLDIAEEITRIILSVDSKKVNAKGLKIQSQLRAIAKCVYVVGLEIACTPVLLLALLAAHHWAADVIYLSIMLVTWPTSILASAVPDQALRSSI